MESAQMGITQNATCAPTPSSTQTPLHPGERERALRLGAHSQRSPVCTKQLQLPGTSGLPAAGPSPPHPTRQVPEHTQEGAAAKDTPGKEMEGGAL